MAKTDPKVMALVEKELEKKPDASVEELYEKAKSKEQSIGELTHRQFHARYPLQVKRRKSGKTRGRSGGSRRRAGRNRKSSATGDQREKVRQTFLRFATDLTASDERGHLVKILADVDTYVDDVLKATRR